MPVSLNWIKCKKWIVHIWQNVSFKLERDCLQELCEASSSVDNELKK